MSAAWPPRGARTAARGSEAVPRARALLLAIATACALLATTTAARADVWGYVDAQGVAHFAAERLDERYELFFRNGTSFDSADGLPAAAAETPRAVTVPTQKAKLLAFFDVSPAYKSVKHLMRESAQAHGVEYELLQAIIATESGFDAQAVSPRGAIGLMQVMPATAERYGVRGDARLTLERRLADPRTNIGAGTRYLRDLMRRYPGQLDLVLAAYNAGEGAVQRAGHKVPNFRETQNYVRTVTQLYTLLRPPETLAAQRRGAVPARVRVELAAGVPAGGAVGRGNMPPPLAAGTTTVAETAQGAKAGY
ncbi:MAG: lytic transglycosylase domain-containing protein [Burkholderiaceae bacterium]|nr:lytic transglycosylase domain-containing protein [Burkholderiaceae bacterium]